VVVTLLFDFLFRNQSEKEKTVEDILMKQSPDRRLLPHVPGKHRSGKSRRAISDEEVKKYPYLKFFNGEDLDSHGAANPNRDYFRYNKDGNIESTDDPGAIYYDTIFDNIVDYIMDNLETVEFPDDIQNLINDYLENEDKE
jgi:hypothetical protein